MGLLDNIIGIYGCVYISTSLSYLEEYIFSDYVKSEEVAQSNNAIEHDKDHRHEINQEY